MDNDQKEKLRKKLESGEIDQELYDVIMKRWDDPKDRKDEKLEEKRTDGAEDQRKYSDIRISGSGHLTNVVGREFAISGSGHVSGTVDVEEMRVSGSAQVESDMKISGELEVSGSLRTGGSITAESLDASGSLHAGSLRIQSIDSSGSLQITGDISAKNVEISGSGKAAKISCVNLESSGSLTAEEIKCDSVEISGSIRSDRVECVNFELEIYSSSGRIGELKCTEATVRSKRKFLRSGMVEIGDIHCKTADLESVKAEKVYGDEVIIGDDCDIGYVEAKVLKISENAIVREKKIL